MQKLSQGLCWQHSCHVEHTAPFGAARCSKGRLNVVCMASERRVARVSKQIEREVGTMLQSDKVLQQAVCPEYEAGYDSSISALASITEVKLSSDLQVAKIYLSVYSDDVGTEEALQGLSRLEGYVRSRLAKQMQLRSVPEIRFYHDDAAESGEEVLRLLEKIKRQERGEEEMPPITLPPLPQDERAERLQQLANMKDAAKARKKDDDGFLEFDPSDDAEGFLDEDDDDDEDDESGSDEEFDVVSAYLGKKADPFDYIEEPVVISDARQRQSRQKRRYRSKKR